MLLSHIYRDLWSETLSAGSLDAIRTRLTIVPCVVGSGELKSLPN